MEKRLESQGKDRIQSGGLNGEEAKVNREQGKGEKKKKF